MDILGRTKIISLIAQMAQLMIVKIGENYQTIVKINLANQNEPIELKSTFFLKSNENRNATQRIKPDKIKLPLHSNNIKEKNRNSKPEISNLSKFPFSISNLNLSKKSNKIISKLISKCDNTVPTTPSKLMEEKKPIKKKSFLLKSSENSFHNLSEKVIKTAPKIFNVNGKPVTGGMSNMVSKEINSNSNEISNFSVGTNSIHNKGEELQTKVYKSNQPQNESSKLNLIINKVKSPLQDKIKDLSKLINKNFVKKEIKKIKEAHHKKNPSCTDMANIVRENPPLAKKKPCHTKSKSMFPQQDEPNVIKPKIEKKNNILEVKLDLQVFVNDKTEKDKSSDGKISSLYSCMGVFKPLSENHKKVIEMLNPNPIQQKVSGNSCLMKCKKVSTKLSKKSIEIDNNKSKISLNVK